MTVGKLRDLLHDLPDDMEVMVCDGENAADGFFGVFVVADDSGVFCSIDLTALNVEV